MVSAAALAVDGVGFGPMAMAGLGAIFMVPSASVAPSPYVSPYLVVGMGHGWSGLGVPARQRDETDEAYTMGML